MSMPEATIDKHASAVFAQHNIGMSRQPWIVQPVSESLTPQVFAHKNFRLRIRRANSSHILMPLLWSQSVH
jgi:hypothetical protein